MYYCENPKCGKLVGTRKIQYKQIVKKRDKIYYDKDDNEVGRGWEIEKEINICAKCAGVKEEQKIRTQINLDDY